jgi:transcriptional regulator with XRE-family HTH domain
VDEEVEKREQARTCSKGTYLTSLRSVRQQKAWTQRRLAARAGTAQGTISKLEKLERAAYAATIRKLASALGVSPEDLMREHRQE